MIYSNLALALASLGLAHVSSSSNVKPAYYSKISGVTVSGDVHLMDSRGYNLMTSHITSSAGIIFYDGRNPASLVGSFTNSDSYVANDGIFDNSVPMKVPPTLFASTSNNDGEVHLFQGYKRTSLQQWSQIQILSPPPQYAENSDFGASIKADQKTHTRLAVGCAGCNATANGGQVYLYSPNKGGSAWSQSQVLQLDASGYNYLGADVDLHDNILLASVQMPHHSLSTKGYVVYSRGPRDQDSFDSQQVLSMKYGNITSASIYEETIVISNANAAIGSVANAGEVHILYPSKGEFGLKPASKPRPVQWSVQQVLRASDHDADDLFGASVSIDRNTLIVAATGADSAYIFHREEQSGHWSQQQILSVTAPLTTSAAGSRLAASVASTTSIFTNQDNWDCLIISLEDHFGDGWDTAELIVDTPVGTQDYFAQSCELENPVQLRYCPTVRSDGGLYSFSLPGAVKAKHYWEIQWGIFDESSGMWYRGKWDTKMDFHWDPDTLTFSPRKMERTLANSTTCTPCPSRPTEKPTPVLRRNLKAGDDNTRSPTVSPAPTLDVTSSDNWRFLTLYGDSNAWFNKQYQGTNYYVADAHAHRLVNTGTNCGPTGSNSQCWLDLPDGDYILRVGGALDVNQGDHDFTFCKMVNQKPAGHQMMFRIQDGDCSIVTFASRSSVCQSAGYAVVSNFYLVLNVNMIIHGTSVSEITSAERSVFGAAIASMFTGVDAADVTLVSVTSSGSGTFVNANIRMSSSVGYNLLDFDGESSFESFLKDTFSSHSKELSLAAALTSGEVASAFSQVSRVEFVDYHIVDSLETLPATQVDEVTSYADTLTHSIFEANPSETNSVLVESVSYSGYFLAAVGVLFIAGFLVAKNRQVDEKEVVVASVLEESSSRHTLTSGKTLSHKELQELADMENEYLKIVSK